MLASAPTPRHFESTPRLSRDTALFALTSPAAWAITVTAGSPEPWLPAKHLTKLNALLVDVEQGRLRRLIIQMPPRHGKSLFVSQHFAAWYLANHPDRFVMLASYADHLARRFSRAARDEFAEWSPMLGGVKLSDDVSARSDWQTTTGGGMFAAGVGGSFTGRGASIGIIDDPVKNYMEAQSRTSKESVWDFYTSSFYTRLTPKDNAVIAIMARWAEDDLVGRLIASWKAEKTAFEVVDLPAIAEDDDDTVGRRKGEALWPSAGWTVERLEEVRRELGTRQFRALYQGRPSKGEGAVFQRSWFRYFTLTENAVVLIGPMGVPIASYARTSLRVFQMVDLAVTVGGGDYFVDGTFAVCPQRELLVLDIYRAQIAGSQQLGVLQANWRKWGATRIGIESQGYQASLVQAAVAQGLPAVPITRSRGQSKELRSYGVAARYEAGAVYHLRHAAWLGEFERELEDFPNGAHDDQVDVLSDAGAVVMEPMAVLSGQAQGVRV